MDNKGFLKQKPGFATTAIHTGYDPDDFSNALVLPIFTASTYKLSAPVSGVVGGEIYYGRCGNPTRNSLEQALAALDGGKHGFSFASGHGAMMTIFTLLSQGDHIIATEDIYAGTRSLLREIITRMGIELTFTDLTTTESVKKAIRNNTKMIWIETPTNPTMNIIDIAAISKLVKNHGDIMVAVDNTILTPYFQRPLDFGADIVMYSLTKFMNGHSDVIMGAAIVNDDKIAERLTTLQMFVGAVPSPIDCYLLSRGLKTLSVRMERHKQSSEFIAKWLLEQPYISKVLHPGLPDHPQHELAKRQTSGHSGIFSFQHSGGLEESKSFLASLKLFKLAVSFGGCESLLQLPCTMTHGSIPKEQRLRYGITDSLIRVSIGLEDPDDLIQDLNQAFILTFGINYKSA